MNAFTGFLAAWEEKQKASLAAAHSAVATIPTEEYANFVDQGGARLGHFLQTTGAVLIGREVLTDDEHGNEASTPTHRERCVLCRMAYESWRD